MNDFFLKSIDDYYRQEKGGRGVCVCVCGGGGSGVGVGEGGPECVRNKLYHFVMATTLDDYVAVFWGIKRASMRFKF